MLPSPTKPLTELTDAELKLELEFVAKQIIGLTERHSQLRAENRNRELQRIANRTVEIEKLKPGLRSRNRQMQVIFDKLGF